MQTTLPGKPQAQSQRRIVKSIDPVAHGLPGRLSHQSRHFIEHHFWGPTDARRQTRLLIRHRFQIDDAKAFVARRQDQHMTARQGRMLVRFRQTPKEMHAVSNAQRTSQRL